MKISGKMIKKLNERAIAVLILLATACYLLATSAVAQSSITSDNGAKVAYDPDYLSYGDMYSFSESAYETSNYGLTNATQTVSLYKSSDADQNGAQNYTFYQYYGSVTTGNHSNVSNGAEMKNHAYTQYHSGYEKATAPAAVDGETVPVLTTEGTGVYTLVPGSTGSYRVYVYSETDPSGSVFYELIDSYIKANAYTGVPTQSLNFTRVADTNYWYASVTVDYLSWSAYHLTAAKSTNTASSTQADTNGAKPYTGSQKTNTTLGGSTYYYNVWTATEILYDTLLAIRWDSGVSLGPVTKQGDTLTINNTDTSMGSLSAINAFGEPVAVGSAVSTSHAPVYIMATPASDEYVFSGFGDAELSLVDANQGIYRYGFESTSTLSGSWMEKEALPTVKISGSYTGSMDFFAATSATAQIVSGTQGSYTLTVDYTDAEDTQSVTYTVTSAGTTIDSGTITEDSNTIQASAQWDALIVSITATGASGNSYTAKFTVNVSNAGLVDVAQIGTTKYQYIEDALAAATSGQTITIINSKVSFVAADTVPAAWTADANGDGLPDGYTVKSGVKLVIPYSSTGSTTPTGSSDDYPYALYDGIQSGSTSLATSPNYEYRKLTLPVGKTMYVMGQVNTGGTLCGTGVAGSTSGSAANTYSVLEINGDMEVRSGGIVSSCGYIYGSGTLSAKSGAKLYQPLVICDFRGGGYTVGAAGKSYATGTQSGESYVSPFLRYTTQNIQSTVKMEEGALMYGYSDLYAGGDHNRTTGVVVGSSTVDGLIKLNTGATLTATYDKDDVVSAYPYVGHADITIEGGASFGILSLTTSGQTITTDELTFPIPYNYAFHLNGAGSTYNIAYSMVLLPGATLEVGEGATLDVGNSSSGFRFMVMDGFNDHTSSGKDGENMTVTYGQRPGSNYPTTANLQAAGKSGTADLIVNGTLNINNGVNFGGVVQAGSADAKLVMDAGATPKCSVQAGLVGDMNMYIYHYYFAGATVRTLNAQVVDRGTGVRTDIVAGQTYYGAEGSDIIPDYTYKLYTNSASKTAYETHTEALNATVQGSWYNYTATVHMVDSSTHEILSTTETYFCHGADVSDYWLDQQCTQPATMVTQNNMVLYSDNIVARVEWSDSSPVSYYSTLRNAVKDAVNPGDQVVLMSDIKLDKSVPIDASQNIGISLGDNGTPHTIAYTSTPFVNGGSLTLDVGGGTITNLADGIYTETPAVINNAEGHLTVDTNGGSISVIYDSKTNATYVGAIVNYGTMAVGGTGGSIICKNLENIEVKYATTAAVAKQGTSAYDASYTSTVNSKTDYLCGIYNTGTIADITGTAEIFGAYYGIYNGNGTTSTTARIENISGGIIRSDYIALDNYYASIGTISGGNFSVTDQVFFIPNSWGTCRGDVLYNYGGNIGEITGGSFTIENTVRRTATLTFYSYYDNKGTAANYTHYYAPGYALYNYRAQIGTIGNAVISSKSNYAIFNYGGQVGTIDGTTIMGRYGINNRNYRATNNTTEAGATIGELAIIDIIRNVTIDVNRYGIYNGATINEISGTSFITATPDSAQDDTPESAIDGNVQGYAIYNSSTWYYDTAIQKRTDDTSSGVLVRTDVYDTVNKPTIGKITGDVTITAINTGNSVEHGVALYNAGKINEISGNATFRTSIHPSNTGLTYSRYAIQNTGGGIIESIEGNVTLSAGDRALLNSSYITGQSVTTYTTTSASVAKHQEVTYVPSRIGDITGDTSGKGVTIEATINQYGILNYSEIGDITGKVTITADKNTYAISNQYDGAYTSYIFDWSDDGAGTEKSYRYTRATSTIGAIGGGDSEILISSLKGYSLYNFGEVEAIRDGVTIRVVTGDTNYYAALHNGDNSQTAIMWTDTNLGANAGTSGRYDLKREYTYTYLETGGHIGTIEGTVTITTPKRNALYNYGTIDRIGNGVQLNADDRYALNNTRHYVGTRDSIRYYYGTSAFATTTAYFAETNLAYTMEPANIAVIDGTTITANLYSIYNGGDIGSIINSTITAVGERAISNNQVSPVAYENTMSTLPVYDAATGKYTATVTDSITQREAGVIGLLGGGNTISGTTNVVFNSGKILAIDNMDADGNVLANSTITASTGIALYNYQGYAATVTKISGTDVNSNYVSATMGTVKNVIIKGVTYSVKNGDTSTTYPNLIIEELGEGVEATATGTGTSYGVYNASNAKLNAITGGIYTHTYAGKYAVYNASTSAPIAISAGDFKGGTNTDTTKGRAYAIYEPDNAKRQTYPEGLSLSKEGFTESVTFADGTTADGYYFIGKCYIVKFWDKEKSETPIDTQFIRVLEDETSGSVELPPLEEREEKAGYTTAFNGWYTQDGTGNKTYVANSQEGTLANITSDMDVYAEFKTVADTYTITLDTASGTIADENLPVNDKAWTPMEDQTGYTLKYTVESDAITLPDVSHENPNFTFVGWKYEDTEGVAVPEGTTEGIMDSVTIPAGTIGNLTYTAAYTGPEVNYYLDEISSVPLKTDDAAEGMFTVPADEEFTALEEDAFIVPEGMSMDGWKDAKGTLYAAGEAYPRTDNLSLYANWRPNEYTITLMTGAEGENITDSDDQPVADGTTLTVTYGQALESLPELRRSGYVFIGWKDADGNTVSNETLMGAADMSLTAVWEVQPDSVLVVSAQNKSMPYGTVGTTLDVILEDGLSEGYTYQWYKADGEIASISEDADDVSVNDETGEASDEAGSEEQTVSDKAETEEVSVSGEKDAEELSVSDDTAGTEELTASEEPNTSTDEMVSAEEISTNVQTASGEVAAEAAESSIQDDTVSDAEEASEDAAAVEGEETALAWDGLTGTLIDSALEPTAAESSYVVPSDTPVGEYWYFCRITAPGGEETDVPVKLTVTPLKVTEAIASVKKVQNYRTLLSNINVTVPNADIWETSFAGQDGNPIDGLTGSYEWETPDTELLKTGYYNLVFIPDDTENYDYSSLRGWKIEDGTGDVKVTIAAGIPVQKVHMVYLPYAEGETLSYYILTEEDGTELACGTLNGYNSYVFSIGKEIRAVVAKSSSDAKTMLGLDDTATILTSSTDVYMLPVPEGESAVFKIAAENGYGSFFDYTKLTENEWQLSEDGTLAAGGVDITFNDSTFTLEVAEALSADTWMAFGGVTDNREEYTVTVGASTISYTDFAEALEYANSTTDAVLKVPAGRNISGNINVNRNTALVVENGAIIAEDTSIVLLGNAVLNTGKDTVLQPVGKYSDDSSGEYTVYKAAPQLEIKAATLTIGDQISINYAVESGTEGSVPTGVAYSTLKETLFTALHKNDLTNVDMNEKVSDSVSLNGYTVLKTQGVKPTEMGQTMYTTAYADTNGEKSYSQVAGYSVSQYAKSMLSNSKSSDSLKELLSAMLRYGAAAELHFDSSKTTALATDGVVGMTAQGNTDKTPDSNKPTNDDGTAYSESMGVEAGLQIALALDESVNFVIQNESGGTEGIDSVQIALYNPNTSQFEPEMTAEKRTVKDSEAYVGGAVPPRNYDNWYRITVTKDGKVYTAIYSVFTYLNKASSVLETNLYDAMAEYCHAAEDYYKESYQPN